MNYPPAPTLISQLQQLEADMTAREVAIDAREAALALAHEQLSQDSAAQLAYQAGVDAERQRVLLLIAAQLDQLDRRGLNALSLRTLRTTITSGGS